MNTETGQSEDASTANPAAASVEENGATQTADGATSGGEQGHEGDDNQDGQGQQQSKSQNSKQRARRKLRESETRNAQLAEDNRKLAERLDTLERNVDGVINPPAERPQRVDYESEEDYEDALHDWRSPAPAASSQPTSEQPAQQQAQQPGTQQQPRQVSPEVQKVIDDWQDSCDDASEKYEDFDDVVFKNNELPVTPIMRDALYECGQGGEVVYHLGKNPAEAARIAGLSLSGQVQAINELSKKFTSTTTSAPAPIEPTGGNDDSGAAFDAEKALPEAYRAHRRRQQQRA